MGSQASPDPLRIKKEQAKPWEAKSPHYRVRAVGALHHVSIRGHGWVRPQVGAEQSTWHGPPCLTGHPPQRWSGWGWVDGEEQPTHFHPSGIINRKTVFNWRGKKSAMNNCKPSNICLLRTFLVSVTPLHCPEKRICLTWKQLKYNAKN